MSPLIFCATVACRDQVPRDVDPEHPRAELRRREVYVELLSVHRQVEEYIRRY